MRVLVVSGEFPPGPGGIGTHALAVTRGLGSRGWEATVVTCQDYATENEVERFNATQSFRIVRMRPGRFSPAKAMARGNVIRGVLEEIAPDVVVATGLRSVWLCAYLVPASGRPWLAIGHGKEFGARGLSRAVMRWAFSRADAVICVSGYTRHAMREAGVRHDAVHVIPNGGDAKTFLPLPDAEIAAVRRAMGLEDARILLTVGNVTARKGQDVVIRALAQIRDARVVHYLMAGLPTKEREFSALARELGVAERVHFLGRVATDQLVRLINACDIFVMTSRHDAEGDFEGYGIAVVEAALCARPAVVTEGSGLAEAINDGVTGLGVPENDVDATAAAIQNLLVDTEKRRAMGAAARARALSEQTWDGRVLEYDRLLREIVGTRGAHP